MADSTDRASVLSIILRDTNAAFWQRAWHQFTWAYGEGFQRVRNDGLVMEPQKPAKLLDERFYLAETALEAAATEGGLATSGQKIALNKWCYTLARGRSVAIVQHYVQAAEDMARPARFRELHASVNTFLKSPQLKLGDVPAEVFEPAQVNGILIHGPAGKGFSEQEQGLGFLHFAVPTADYSAWGPNIPVAEIVAAFAANEADNKPAQRDIARPSPKRQKKNDEPE